MILRATRRAAIHDRLTPLVSLIIVAALAWVYLWHEAAVMSSTSPGMTMPMPGDRTATAFMLTFLMWSVMMIGMMLPSAAPAILLYGKMVRENAARGIALAAVWTFTSGYLSAWIAFSLLATAAQLALQAQNLLTMRMESASAWLSSVILIAAGIYQWLPVKHTCLHKCRNPLELFLTRWRPGRFGAFRMGLDHGLFCVGCCWALMLVLFVAGVMNLVWVAVIAAFVFVEKVLPASRVTAHLAGVGLVLAGIAVGSFGR